MNWITTVRRQISWADLEAEQARLIRSVSEHHDLSYLLISEPTPTFTHGISARPSDLLWSEEERCRAGIEVQAVSRGGAWTFHGPGQIVLYPILHLAHHGFDRRAAFRFMQLLREGASDCLEERGLCVTVSERPFGIYAQGAKLASFGMAISRGISSHGMALYHSSQGRFFSGINPCGVEGEKVTSLEQLGVKAEWDSIALQMAEHVKRCLKRHKSSIG